MYKMIFKIKFILYLIIISNVLCSVSFALSIKDNRYYYNTKDFYKSCWQWLDLNNDGVYECYHFNVLGHMTKNSTTPDGYKVNKNGEWVVDGVVQRKDNIGVMASINSNLSKVDTNIYSNVTQEVNTDFSIYFDNFINDRIFDIQNYINVKEVDKKSFEVLRAKYIGDIDTIYNNYYKSLTELYDDKHITREHLKESISVLSETLKDKKKIINSNIDSLKNTITWQFIKEEYDVRKSLFD